MFTVNSTLIWAVLTDPTDWVCHIGTLTWCVEAVAWSCIIITWWSGSGGIQTWSRWPTGFFQCFDTVGLVIWPVKIIPEMAYNMLSGMLSLYTTTWWKCTCVSNHACFSRTLSVFILWSLVLIRYLVRFVKPHFCYHDSLSWLLITVWAHVVHRIV